MIKGIKSIIYCVLTVITAILICMFIVKTIDLFMINIFAVTICRQLIGTVYYVFIYFGLLISFFIVSQKNYYAN